DIEIPLVAGLDVELERHGAEHGRVDVIRRGDEVGVWSEQRIEAGDELTRQRLVLRESREGEGAVPGAGLRVGDALRPLGPAEVGVRRGDEVFGNAGADLARGAALGPRAESRVSGLDAQVRNRGKCGQT